MEQSSSNPRNAAEYREWWAENYPEIPYGTCICSPTCGRRTNLAPQTHRKLLMFKGEPNRYIRGHSSNAGYKGESLESKYALDPASGCWVWRRGKKNGYGLHIDKGVAKGAHVAVYESYYGPVPNGDHLHHLCGNRACVNPDHLQPMTLTEHMRIGPHVKLNPDKARQIRTLYAQGNHLQKDLAKQFGISKTMVRHVINGVFWRNV